MNNDIFDDRIKNKFKNYEPKIPHVVSDRIDKTLACLPAKEKTCRNANYRLIIEKRINQIAIAAIVALTILTFSATVSPVLANALTNIPLVGSVFRLFGDMGLKLADDKGITSLVDKTIVDKDIKVTIRDILYDGTRISFGYTLEGNNIGEFVKPDLLVNGDSINFSMTTYGSPLTENAYAGVININPTSELPKDFVLTVSLNKIGTTEGNWKFENIEVKTQADMLNSKLITPMATKTLSEGGSITVEKIFISDSTIKLHVIESNTRGTVYGYQLIDNYGNILQPMGGSGYGTNGIENKEYTFIPWNNNPAHFVIKVLDNKNQIVDGRVKDIKTDITGNFPITISQGEGGEIFINKIEYLSNKTLVHYSYKGNDPYGNGMCVWIEDGAGNRLDNQKKSIQRNIDGSYILEGLPMDRDKKIKVATRKLSDVQSVLEFDIPLK